MMCQNALVDKPFRKEPRGMSIASIYVTSSTTTAIPMPLHFGPNAAWKGIWTLRNVGNRGIWLLNSYLIKTTYRMKLLTPFIVQRRKLVDGSAIYSTKERKVVKTDLSDCLGDLIGIEI